MGDRKEQIQELVERINAYKRGNELDFYSETLQEIFGDFDNEAGLTQLLSKSPELAPDIEKVFDAIMNAFRRYDIFWINDETQAGFYLMTSLNDGSFRHLIRFIDNCDIDHEVDLLEEVLEVISTHGYTEDTFAVLAAYSFQSQHGDELLDVLMEEHDLIEEMENEEQADSYLAALTDWLNSDAKRVEFYADSPYDLIDTLAGQWEELFDLDSDDAEKYAENYAKIFKNEKKPTLSDVAGEKKKALAQGTGEEMIREVLIGLDTLAKKVYDSIEDDSMKRAGDFFVSEPPSISILCEINIEGSNRNTLFFSATLASYGNWERIKYTNLSYSDVPKSFLENELMTAVKAWLQEKLDSNAYPGMFGGSVPLKLLVESKKKYVWDFEGHDMVYSEEKQKEWLEYFRSCIKNKEYEKGSKKFRLVNYDFWKAAEDGIWELEIDEAVAFVDTIDTLDKGFELFISNHFKQLHEKDNVTEKEITRFGKILDTMNRAYEEINFFGDSGNPIAVEPLEYVKKKGYKSE